MRKHTWHRELKYSMKQRQGRTKNEDNYSEGTMEGAWEAMSRIIIQQENERQLNTIRAGVIEWSIWKDGGRVACRMWTKHSENVGITRSAQKHAKMCKELGIELLRLGLNISAQIMSAKMEWVLQNITWCQHVCLHLIWYGQDNSFSASIDWLCLNWGKAELCIACEHHG